VWLLMVSTPIQPAMLASTNSLYEIGL
jgi:hypothetical protein